MTSPGGFTPYSTLDLFFPKQMPGWIPELIDQQRIESYLIYEQIYWNVPTTFKLVARGQEDKPIYVPAARTIIEATNRYIAPDFGFTIVPRADVSATMPDEVVAQATEAFADLFTRERFFSKFSGNKRYGLIRGDWLWHLVADPTKPEGSRISIYPLDPASYFPIWHDDDLDRVIGCHIVDTFTNDDDKTLIKRLTYRKNETPGGAITVEEAIFELDDWQGPKAKPVQIIRPPQLVAGITSIPVYHIKNFEEPANPFGSSELRGVERLLGAINQSISDEDLALALEGLGLYATDAPPPTNDDGEPVDWILGPGRVVEHPPNTSFNRISGVGSVTPYQDHLGYLERKLFQALGVSDAAMGIVDVSVAQSGISLQLQFQPMVAKTNEKDQDILSVHAQMFYDLATQWMPTYEGLNFEGLKIMPRIGGKIPVDRVAKLTELNDMLDRQVISAAYYRLEASKLGYTFPDNIQDEIAQELAAKSAAEAAADPFTQRMNAELNSSGGSTDNELAGARSTAIE
jgi:hypothetical protein